MQQQPCQGGMCQSICEMRMPHACPGVRMAHAACTFQKVREAHVLRMCSPYGVQTDKDGKTDAGQVDAPCASVMSVVLAHN